jgi:RHS repeat-associated protein
VDEDGEVISYEEYHPYGTSAYRAVDSSVDVSAKRYRYTGMERDEETGLEYHSARYYAPWLGRWTAADPIGLGDGPNRYSYVRGNASGSADPTGNGEPEPFVFGEQPASPFEGGLEPEPQVWVTEESYNGPVPGTDADAESAKIREREKAQLAIEEPARREAYAQQQKERAAAQQESEAIARRNERTLRDARIDNAAKEGKPLFPADGTGEGPGRHNTNENGNRVDALGNEVAPGKEVITRIPEGVQPVDTPLDPGLPERVSQAYLEVGVTVFGIGMKWPGKPGGGGGGGGPRLALGRKRIGDDREVGRRFATERGAIFHEDWSAHGIVELNLGSWPAAFEQAAKKVVAENGKFVFDLTTVDVRGTLASGRKAIPKDLEALNYTEWELLYLVEQNPEALARTEFWLNGQCLGHLTREQLGGL